MLRWSKSSTGLISGTQLFLYKEAIMKNRWSFVVPVFFLLAAMLLFRFVLFIGYVPTESMEPALPNGFKIMGETFYLQR